jgi:hypothetical protein
MEYTDPATGKTATLTYKEVNITITDEATFDRVLVYLIPDSLTSFQLMKRSGSAYQENLNSLFRYDAIVLAYKGVQAYFYRHVGVESKAFTFSLSPINEAALKTQLKGYTLNKENGLKTAFEYQLFEQQEALRQVLLQKDIQFREQVAASIFNCNDMNLTPPASK